MTKPTVKLTVVTKDSGPLTKIMSLQGGKLVKDSSQCRMDTGTAQTVETTLAEMPTFLRSLKPNQALVHGTAEAEKARIVTQRAFNSQQGTITRTKDCFNWNDGPGLMFFDYDPEPGATPLNSKQLVAAMAQAMPAIANMGYVATPSTSSCIFDADGNELRGVSGLHNYSIVKNARDLPRFKEALFKRCWLSGHGSIKISAAGGQLLRTIFDAAVFSPERLDFVAGAICQDGLIQRLPKPVYVPGDVLDTSLCLDLTVEEEAQYKQLVIKAKEATAAEATKIKGFYVKTAISKIQAARPDLSETQARKIIEASCKGDLWGDFVLTLDNGDTATVNAILANPGQFDKETFYDPLEPETGPCKAMFYANTATGKPCLNSMLHGGRQFFLHAGHVVDEQRDQDTKQPLMVTDIHSLLAMEIPPRRNLMAPIIQEQSLNMIHAWRGVGKTHTALGIVYAVAAGGAFLKWSAESARKTIYVDGEMPISALQDRLAAIALMNDTEPPEGFLKLITPDLQSGAMPDLGTKEGQELVDSVVDPDTSLIVIDNLSCLVRAGGKENDAESWLSVSEWALRHRAAGRSILFIHHSGKSGNQRGTSKREDLLDTVICLKHPADYDPSQGAQFEVNFEKARGLHGDDVRPFEARLITDDKGRPSWTIRDVEDSTLERCVELFKLGLKQAEIAVELDINKSNVSRALRKAEQQGLIVIQGGAAAKKRNKIDRSAGNEE
ncbi:MAG: AAA family ATPase [Proteobacteria bacterium]|nr:AAA family ATPase [Pseudomonadota bacterium]